MLLPCRAYRIQASVDSVERTAGHLDLEVPDLDLPFAVEAAEPLEPVLGAYDVRQRNVYHDAAEVVACREQVDVVAFSGDGVRPKRQDCRLAVVLYAAELDCDGLFARSDCAVVERHLERPRALPFVLPLDAKGLVAYYLRSLFLKVDRPCVSLRQQYCRGCNQTDHFFPPCYFFPAFLTYSRFPSPMRGRTCLRRGSCGARSGRSRATP